MKRWLQSRWFWAALVVVAVPFWVILSLRQDSLNVMYPALDKLAKLPLGERWSSPDLIKIREFGKEAVPPLRRVLREKDRLSTQLLFWAKGKWPGIAKRVPYFPDAQKMTERRWAACQVLQTLGPAGKSATPELVKVLASKDPADVNAAVMALWAVGIDENVCERLDAVLEKGNPGFGRYAILSALGAVKPPSTRTLNALTAALSDSSIQSRAAETLGQLGVATPAVVAGLKRLQTNSTDVLMVTTASAALWELQKDSAQVLAPVFQALENELPKPVSPPAGGGNGGQGLWGDEQAFMKAAELFPKMNLGEADKSKALKLLESFCDKSGRIFVRMLLLPAMMELGLPREKCVDICNTGLQQDEDYYRLQAARLLTTVAKRYSVDEIDLDALLHDKDVGVRVYAAKVHWQKKNQAGVVVPVLVEALDRKKHQSYYYMEILAAALNALAEIGPDARAAESEVNALTRDPNPTIAKLATETLNKLHTQ